MGLELYNTRTRELEPVDWPKDHVVSLYTCGPTVYNTAHLGNLRTYIFEDVLKRTLEFNGYQVQHVMNITDVGHLTGDGDMGKDKVEEQAKSEQKSAYDIAAFHTKEFFDDLQKLNIEPPTTVLKATDTIAWQIDLIKKLEANGFTYRTSDGIYYDTSKYSRYGNLSGQKPGEKKAGARVEVNDEKKQPSDFALWKFSKPEDQRQMEWDSPWGTGFPGWHIECSAMSIHEFPQGLDIHCGGIDHIPVHHENEIAQNEGAGYHNFVNFWMHGEFLKLPGKRMGKSEGNAITLHTLIDQKYNPLAFRYLVLLTHYRKPLNYSDDALFAASNALNRIWLWLFNKKDSKPKFHEGYKEQVIDAINKDLNTADVIAVIHRVISDNDINENQKVETLAAIDKIVVLDLIPEKAKKNILAMQNPVTAELLRQYTKARAEKRFDDSDKIRQQFADMGLVVEDTPEGSRLRKK